MHLPVLRACCACLVTAAVLFVAAPVQAAAKSVSSHPLDDIKARAAKIDDILEKAWADNDVPRNGRISNETFLRRTYLKIAGRIPTFEETVTFLKSPDRSRLIDQLLLQIAKVFEISS